MSTNSSIEWCDHTFNPWWGCVKVSQGCAKCYALSLATRYGHDIWGPRAHRRFFGEKHWQEPLRWNKQAEKDGIRRKVFCASMADVFEKLPDGHPDTQAMDEARERLWLLIEQTEHLDWLVLTKRPERIMSQVPYDWYDEFPANVWIGTSVESPAVYERIDELRRVPAVVRFISAEPLLAVLTNLDLTGIHWLIAGGESGPGARPMHPDWVRSLRDQCQAIGVAFFMKQWGEYAPVHRGTRAPLYVDDQRIHDDADLPVRQGKHHTGRLLDGRTWDEFPTAVPA